MPDSIVVNVNQLTRRFGSVQALNGVSLQIRPGRVYGLVGANGQGKTTLIKHLVGLLKPQQGDVKVFGMEPIKQPVEVLRRIGYLSENRELPGWMRIDELLRYTSAFYPGWDNQYANELMESFGLDPARKIKALSKGMRAQAGLIAAVAHRPELLLLDEPSSGLDALVRRDILNAIVRTVACDGRATLFSSHLLDEVEAMSDEILMMEKGRVVLQGSIEEIRRSHHAVIVKSSQEPRDIRGVVATFKQQGDSWRVIWTGQNPSELDGNGIEIESAQPATLQDVFLARAGRDIQSTNQQPEV